MLNKIFKSVSNGEIIKVVEFNEKSKQCIVELENGKTRAYSSATLKDKRKFTPVEDEHVEETVEDIIGKDTADLLKTTLKDITTATEEPETVETEVSKPTEKKHNIRKSLRLKEVTYKGETKSIRECAEETGMPWKTLYNRINNNGWPVDLAIETPIGERKPKEV